MRMRAGLLLIVLACRPDLSGPAGADLSGPAGADLSGPAAQTTLPYAQQALNLGRTSDDALYESFTTSYQLTGGDTIDHVEIVTEFRRAVMIVRDRARQGNYSMTAQDLGKAMAPFQGQVTVIAQARLHPLHTYPSPPLYDLYVETGPATAPVAAKPLKRDPVYPVGLSEGASMSAVRLEGTFRKADIDAASAPMLVVTDDQANIIWKTRIDLARYR
jgi:hypothetical protein